MNADLLNNLIMGVIHGLTQWLPISSQSALIFFKNNFFADAIPLSNFIKFILLLHLGTFFSALVYFWSDIKLLVRTAFNYKRADIPSKKLLNFIIFSTVISCLFGFVIIGFLSSEDHTVAIVGKAISLFIGFLLLGIASIELRHSSSNHKDRSRLGNIDSLILGIGQVISVFPGVSRSGITSSLLLLRNYDKKEALKISFLMSMPIILLGNLFLNSGYIISSFTTATVVALIFSFIAGLLSLYLIMKFVDKISYGWFVLITAIITIASGLLLS